MGIFLYFKYKVSSFLKEHNSKVSSLLSHMDVTFVNV